MPHRSPIPSTHQRSTLIVISQSVARWFFRILFLLFYRLRVYGLENYPAKDGFLICANHQSFLDPIIIGASCPRPINYLARQSLFRFPPLTWFLLWNDAIPIDRDGSGIAGIKQMLRRLGRKESILMFPEGTRTSDGELQPIKLGFLSVAKRAKAPLLPVCFAGAFQSWPRDRQFPIPGHIDVVIGNSLSFHEYGDLPEEQVGELLQRRMQDCFESARQRHQQRSLAKPARQC